jgi:integrase
VANVRRRAPQTPGGVARYRVRYTDPAGKKRSKSFAKAVDAKNFAATVETDKLRGSYIDPNAGKITLAEYLDAWLAAQTFAESSRESTETRVRVHILPRLGERPICSILPSHVQAWIRGLQRDGTSPIYIKVIFANLSAVLNAAVDDDLIRKNPCNAGTVKLPRLDPSNVQAWEPEDVMAVEDALPGRYQIMVPLGAQCGLRQGEIFGLGVEHIDFMRGKIHVLRQVKIVRSRQVFDLPKGGKTRVIDDVPEDVLMALARHLQRWPAVTVTLPWQKPDGREESVKLVLSTRERTALQRFYVNAHVWKKALREVGIEPDRHNMMHVLRHTFAATLLADGISVDRVASWLGHSDPGFTLRYYAHFVKSQEHQLKNVMRRLYQRPAGIIGPTA